MLWVSPEFLKAWEPSQDLFQQIINVQGKVFRQMDGRRTLQFEHQGQCYFIKAHFGVGWKEIFKNLLSFKWPVIGASNEWKAIQRCEQLNIPTMQLVAYGAKGGNPATRQSFVVTKDLGQTQDLEVFCAQWPQWEMKQAQVKIKRQILAKIVWITRQLHQHGLNHRDLYLCHFLLDMSKPLEADAIGLFIIDLHRVQIRQQVPQRWLIKDLAALYFSSMDIGLTKRDVFRFLKSYRQQPLRQILTQESKFWLAVQQRAVQHYCAYHQRQPLFPNKVGFT